MIGHPKSPVKSFFPSHQATGHHPASAAGKGGDIDPLINSFNALNSCQWNTGKTARMLGKSRRTVQSKIAQYGLKK